MTRQPLRYRAPARERAFTLVEVLVAVGILAVILVVVLGIINATGRAWNGAVARTESFQDARAAFEAINRMLGGATLNAYYQADLTTFRRVSDLQFVSGSAAVTGLGSDPRQLWHAAFFQAPLGYTTNAAYAPLAGALNTCGFYVDYSRDALRPAFLDGVLGANSNPYRFRLHQVLQDTGLNGAYATNATPLQWIAAAVPDASGQNATHPLAANVVALVLVPEDPSALGAGASSAAVASSIAATYDFDSRNPGNANYLNQLPPVVEVFLAAIDEASAKKVCTGTAAPELGQSTLFRDTAKLEADIQALDANLSAAPGNAAGNRVPLTHRFFRAKVPIQGAKWSS